MLIISKPQSFARRTQFIFLSSECYQDPESLDRLRGDTSVPSYQTPGLYDVGDEDWDTGLYITKLTYFRGHVHIQAPPAQNVCVIDILYTLVSLIDILYTLSYIH
jgi:hypothetical protein